MSFDDMEENISEGFLLLLAKAVESLPIMKTLSEMIKRYKEHDAKVEDRLNSVESKVRELTECLRGDLPKKESTGPSGLHVNPPKIGDLFYSLDTGKTFIIVQGRDGNLAAMLCGEKSKFFYLDRVVNSYHRWVGNAFTV